MEKQFTPWLHVSAATFQGNVRESMEDRLAWSAFRVHETNLYLFLVCDGHVGYQVAEYIVEFLPPYLVEELSTHKTISDKAVRSSIRNTFSRLHDESKKKFKAGSTLTLLLILEDPDPHRLRMYHANVGDSLMYAVSDHDTKDVRHLTTNHNIAHNRSEEKRIQQIPGVTTDRVYVYHGSNGLQMTRSIGDGMFSKFILADPAVHRYQSKQNRFVMASDGVWDVVSMKNLIKQAQWGSGSGSKSESGKNSADLLKWRNKTFEQHDNTALLIVNVDWKRFEKSRFLTLKEMVHGSLP